MAQLQDLKKSVSEMTDLDELKKLHEAVRAERRRERIAPIIKKKKASTETASKKKEKDFSKDEIRAIMKRLEEMNLENY